MRGFGYVYFLIMIGVLLMVMTATTGVLYRYKNIIALDRAYVTARYMADSALAYESVETPANQNVSQPTTQMLLVLPGVDYAFGRGGFRIVEAKGIRYYVGYAGRLPSPAAICILFRQGTKVKPYEN
jgi:hypothetical protein